MNAQETFVEGCKILAPPLVSVGFQFVSGPSGRSSGGNFASGRFVRNGRTLELHFRNSLGLVTYAFRGHTASHESVVRAIGSYGKHTYPGFFGEPLDGFRHLRSDLEHFFQVFLTGTDEDLENVLLAAVQQEAARPKGIRGIP